MVGDVELEKKLGSALASLAEKLASQRGGRLVLALASGALSLVPVAGASVVEYKNLYASASTDEKLSQLAEHVIQLSRILQDHANQLELLFKMIVDICNSLNLYLGDAAVSKLEDIDIIADSLLRPPTPYVTKEELKLDRSEILLEEKQYGLLLALLDESPNLRTERSRLLRVKALYGLGRFNDIYITLKKEPLQSLSQEELESLIWACFELGYIVDATQGLLYHEKAFSSPVANLFRRSIKTRFGGKYKIGEGGKAKDE
jgi:hypothetical protein